jgi:hypothetical protein
VGILYELTWLGLGVLIGAVGATLKPHVKLARRARALARYDPPRRGDHPSVMLWDQKARDAVLGDSRADRDVFEDSGEWAPDDVLRREA